MKFNGLYERARERGWTLAESQLPSMAKARPASWNRAPLASDPMPSCGAEMNLFRRFPEHVHHGYEVQVFSKCVRKLPRSETARRHSVTRSPRGVGHRRSV